MEALMRACGEAHNIKKSVEDDIKGKGPISACSNFTPQLQKVVVEEHLEEIAFVNETINEAKKEFKR